MRIVLGSTSTDKIKILRKVLNSKIKNLVIVGVEGDSKITGQPLSEEITVTGAVNRAQSAIKLHDADLGVGMEGGVTQFAEKHYYLVCACAIADKSNNVYIGVGSKLRVPREVGEAINNGRQFGDEIRSYAQKHKNDTKFNKLARELISREKSFGEAIGNAYLSYINSSHM